MANDIRQTKVLKHNKEQDIQCNGKRYKTNKSPKTQQRAGHTIPLFCFKTFVCLISLAIVLYVLLFVVF
jgi:hypothetical protein